MSKRKLAASFLLATGLLALTAAAGSARPLGASRVARPPEHVRHALSEPGST